MYAGRIAEIAPVDRLFARPCHPYTALLLAAVPRLDLKPKQLLATIEGKVPAAGDFSDGCRFADRCPLAGDRCRVDYLACLGIRDRGGPQALAGFEVIGQYPSVQGPTKQTAVQVSSATIDRQEGEGFVVFMRTPDLLAVRRINRDNIKLGGKDESTVNHDGACLETLTQMGVVGTQYLQSVHVLRIDLA